MKQPLRFSDIFINILLLAGLVAIWVAFAPIKVGGRISYVLVNGISMEPNFHSGDLVVVRKADEYIVGNVVTYRDGEMSAYVIHRIIAIEQGEYILQGDNNDWVDAYHPLHDEIIGKLWIHVPNMGKVFQWLRTPVNMALVLSLLGGVLMTTVVQPTSRGKSRRSPNTTPGAGLELPLYFVGIMVLLFLAISIFAFVQPAMRPANAIEYQHTGVFFYSASGAPNIYDTEMIRSGEPIFPKLTCALNVGYVYTLTGNQLQGVSGSYQLIAHVTDEQSGWKRTIPLGSQTAFSGNNFSTTADIDLCQVQSLVYDVEQQTGFRPATYTLTIIPSVSVAGKVAGLDLQDAFEARLAFKFDKVHFYLGSTSKDGKDPLSTSRQGKLLDSGMQENTLSLFGKQLSVIGLRVLGLSGLGLSLGCLLILGLYLSATARRNPASFHRIKHGHLLIDVYERSFESSEPVIDVTSLDDLARLAERQNVMILHLNREPVHYYFVQSNGTTYRYVVKEQYESGAQRQKIVSGGEA